MIQHNSAIRAIGVSSDSAQKIQIFGAFFCEEFRGEGGFLVDKAIVYILIFFSNAFLLHDSPDTPVAIFEREQSGEFGLFHHASRPSVLLALEGTEVGELHAGGDTFMSFILLRWKSLARSSCFLWITRLATGISLFIDYLYIIQRSQLALPLTPEGSEVGVARDEGDLVEDGVQVVAGVHSVTAGADHAVGQFKGCGYATGDGGPLFALLDLLLQFLLLRVDALQHHALQLFLTQRLFLQHLGDFVRSALLDVIGQTHLDLSFSGLKRRV